MKAQLLAHLNRLRRDRVTAVLVKNLASGEESLFEEGDLPEGELAAVVERAFRSGNSALTNIDGAEFFVNAYLPPARIVVVGAVHISQALAPMARLVGFDLTIIDPRTAFATPERFENSELFARWPDEVLQERPLDRYCALAAVTHDPKIDDPGLIAALQADCFYIGALGSRKTHAARVQRLTGAGIDEKRIASIRAPIGMDIGAASPPQIALAIMAEIVDAFHRRKFSGNSAAASDLQDRK